MEINAIAILVASAASFAFGALWYSPVLMLRLWAGEAGVDPQKGPENPGRVYGLTALFTVISAFALDAMVSGSALTGAIQGLGVGICVAMTSLGINYQFAGRSATFWLIDGGFHALRFAIMGAILAPWT